MLFRSLKGLKPRLEEPLHHAAGAWVEELPYVLWSIRTTLNRSTGYTPFFLVYGAEAVLPTDMIHDSPRVQACIETDAEEARQDSLGPVLLPASLRSRPPPNLLEKPPQIFR